MPAKPTILVTSAAGHTGRPAVLQLLKKGFPVRAFVRTRDQRTVELERIGAEIVVGDLRDFRDLRRALRGVQRAYHCPPFSANALYDSTLFAVAAEEAKLEVVALMGAWNVHPTHPSIHQRGHWIAHQIYRWMPSVDVIHLAPGFFAFDYFLGLPAVVHFGMLMAPLGDGLNAPPSNEDIAAVAVGALADPAPHLGKSYRPTGPRLIAPRDIAEIMGRELGRTVVYKDVAFKTFQKAAIAQGYPLSQIAHIRHYAEEVSKGTYATGAPTDHVRLVTGKEPEDFESITRRYIQHPELVYPSLRIGSKWEAYRFLLKMMVTAPIDFDAWERHRGHPLLANPELAHDSAEWRVTAERQQLNLLPLAHVAGRPSGRMKESHHRAAVPPPTLSPRGEEDQVRFQRVASR